jgi:hypothetical protein
VGVGDQEHADDDCMGRLWRADTPRLDSRRAVRSVAHAG